MWIIWFNLKWFYFIVPIIWSQSPETPPTPCHVTVIYVFDHLSLWLCFSWITPYSLNVKCILYDFIEIANLGCKRLGHNCKTYHKIARLCHKIAKSQNLLEITKRFSENCKIWSYRRLCKNCDQKNVIVKCQCARMKKYLWVSLLLPVVLWEEEDREALCWFENKLNCCFSGSWRLNCRVLQCSCLDGRREGGWVCSNQHLQIKAATINFRTLGETTITTAWDYSCCLVFR